MKIIPIQIGTFNCEKDLNFCQLKGWDKPQLILGLAKNDLNKEFVELFNYSNCHANKFENIYNWLESTLRNHLKNKTKSAKSLKGTYLKLFYVQKTNAFKSLPLYYTSLGVKHNRRANFYAVSFDKIVKPPRVLKKLQDEEKFLLETCFDNNVMLFKKQMAQSKTPIFLVMDNKICYNYGQNLNEFPNYAHLNHFLFFFYLVDLNMIFLFGFIFLNSYLILLIFEYDRSSLKQFIRGLLYLCCFNFVLFTICLFAVNSHQMTKMEKSTNLENFANFQFSCFKTELTQNICAYLRFFIYFYAYLQSHLTVVIYLLITITFYFHTRLLYFKAKKLNKKLIQQKKLQLAQKLLVTKESNNTELTSAIQLASHTPEPSLPPIQRDNQLQPSNNLTNTNVLPLDLDLEIGVYDLINQINGLTTIWLQSSTHADRLLSELPTIEFCKCFYAHNIKIKAMDETDRDTTTEDDEDYSSSKLIHSTACFCECEKNKDLRKYFEEKNFKSKVRRECSICLEKYKIGSLLVLLPCGHLFHKRCVYEWFMNSSNCKCPICRTTHYKFNKNL